MPCPYSGSVKVTSHFSFVTKEPALVVQVVFFTFFFFKCVRKLPMTSVASQPESNNIRIRFRYLVLLKSFRVFIQPKVMVDK